MGQMNRNAAVFPVLPGSATDMSTAMTAVEHPSNMHNIKTLRDSTLVTQRYALAPQSETRIDDHVVQHEARGHLYSVQRARQQSPRSKGKVIESNQQ